MKTLILTEKPSVARDFAKALGVNGKKDGYLENEQYVITWAIGHLVELFDPADYDKKWEERWRLDALPILPEQFKYKPIARTENQLNIIKSVLNQGHFDKIVIATDAGREGEVIARTIFLASDFNKPNNMRRFWTSQALTPQVIKEGLEKSKPASFYDRLWKAGQSRQIADWLVGMNGSRAATIQLKDFFTVGRVQTAVLSLLADRRRERENFKPEPFWMLRAVFANDKGTWTGLWTKKKENRFHSEEEAVQVQASIENQIGKVASVKKQKKKQPPPPLYSLTDLQQDANKQFAFSAQTTLDIAQSLYEQKKCLSYPRTDAKVLGSQNADMAKKLVEQLSQNYSDLFAGVEKKLIAASNKRVFDDDKLTDHHALIPLAPLPASAGDQESKLYDLVIRRFAAAFHPDFEFEQTDIVTEVKKQDFQTKGRVILKPGWQALYKNEAREEEDSEAGNLPPLTENDPATVTEIRLEKKMTTPPPEYSEALLLKDMTNPAKYVSEEELKKVYRGDVGLGTQATRAQIIETLLHRNYAQRNKKLIIATDKGCLLIDRLRGLKMAKILTSPEETARWERRLDRIARGEDSGEDFLTTIRQFVSQMVEEFKMSRDPSEIGKCPACGGSIIEGKKGFGCANWKEENGGCKFVIWKQLAGKDLEIPVIQQLLEKRETEPIEGFMSKKGTPFSASLKLVQQEETEWKVQFDFGEPEEVGICPVCGGKVVEGRKGFGCANWKEENGGCKFVIWKTIAQKELPREAVILLLEKGITENIDGFVSKKGSPFSARLKLQKDDSGAYKSVFDFDQNRTM